MNTKLTTVLLVTIVVAIFLIGLFLYAQFPDYIASHWNAAGEVDGYMSKFWGIFIFPLMMMGLVLLYMIIPRVDPLKGNIDTFRSQYNALWLGIVGYMTYIFAIAMIWNLGYQFDFVLAMIPAFALLFYLIGVVLEKSKRNWFVGIRTPWTLSSDRVWDKTHRLSGRLFRLVAVISLAGIFVESSIAVWLIVVPIMVASLATVIYSYMIFRRDS